MDYIDQNGRPASTGPSMSGYAMAKMEQEGMKHLYGKIILQGQGKYQGATQYGIFIEGVEVGRMCREYYGGSGPYIDRGYEWNICFWDMPDHGHQDRFDVPEAFPNAIAARKWLVSKETQIRKLKGHSEPNHIPIKQRIPEHIK